KYRTEFAQGIAITSSIHPTPETHVEACHYGKGSNAMHLMAVPLIDGERHRLLRFLLFCLRHPVRLLHSLWVRRASEKTISLLVMQAADNSLTTYRKRGLFGTKLTSKQGRGEPNPVWIPDGHDVARRVAEKIGGYAEGTAGDLVKVPMTGHFIGGVTIGEDADHGVVDPYQRLYGYPGLHVVDGSTITANLGVNPSLTITAQSERAMAFWPNKGQADPRPPLDFCRNLTPAEWDAPSMADGWRIRDVVAHMGATAHAFLTPGLITVMRTKEIERLNDGDVHARADRPPAELLDEYLGYFPLRLMPSTAIFDWHVHLRHDIAPALGRPGPPTDESRMTAVVEWLTALLQQSHQQQLSWLREPVALTLRGQGGGSWIIEPRTNRAKFRVRQCEGDRAAAHIAGRTEDFPVWATTRKPWRECDVAITGDDQLAARVLDAINLV
ncbi:maleylpyruvate isomerase family mycothiol-dependent enzyme, partial [Aduncisulcus paluster]